MGAQTIKGQSIVALSKTSTDFLQGSLELRKILGNFFKMAWSPVLTCAEYCAWSRVPSVEVDRLLGVQFALPSYGYAYQGLDPENSGNFADLDLATLHSTEAKGTRPESLIARFQARQVDGGDMQFSFCLWSEMTFGWTVRKHPDFEYGQGPKEWMFWLEAWPGRQIGLRSQMLADARRLGYAPTYVGTSKDNVPRRFPEVEDLSRRLHAKFLADQLNVKKALEYQEAQKAGLSEEQTGAKLGRLQSLIDAALNEAGIDTTNQAPRSETILPQGVVESAV